MRQTDGPNQILRENERRRLVVLGNTDGTADMAKVVAKIRAVIADANLPSGFSATLERTFQAQEEASRTIEPLSLVSLRMVFAILCSRCRSVVCALIIMGSVPFNLIGSVVALLIAGQPLSFASMISTNKA